MGLLIEHLNRTRIDVCRQRGAARHVIRRARLQLKLLQAEHVCIQNRLQFISELISHLTIFQAWREDGWSIPNPLGKERFALSAMGAQLRTRSLRRACRVALMEAVEPEPVRAIFERIQRRGSYDFENAFDPIAIVAKELKAMVAEGEALSIR